MKIKYYLLSLVTILCINAYSQNIECYTEYTGSGSSSLLSGSCEETINYATSEEYPEHSPIYYIKVNIHYMLKEDPSNPSNFTETNDGNYPSPSTSMNGYIYAQQLIDNANWHLANNIHMNLPCGNTTPVLDIQYRYVIAGDLNPSLTGADGVYFHRDDDKYWFDINDPILYGSDNSADVLLPESPVGYGYNNDTELNVFIQERDVADTSKHVTGYASSPPDYYHTDEHKPYVILGNCWYKYKMGVSIDPYSKIFNHEVGHDLDLYHSWGSDYCDDTPTNSNCWGINLSFPPCDDICEISNNAMDYNADQAAFTPCQIGRAQYWLMHEPVLNYVLDDYCNIVDADLIVNAPGQNIIWENKRLMKGNVVVTTGTTLTI